MASKNGFHFIQITKHFLCLNSTKEKYKTEKQYFTRNRKLLFSDLSLCMLRMLLQNIQVELGKFLEAIKRKGMSYTTSAFIQSRKKVKPDLFYDLTTLITKDFYKDNDESVKLYKGHRLLAIDGSTINLPVTKAIKDQFGTCSSQHKIEDIVLARASIMYDFLNEMILDGKLSKFSVIEVFREIPLNIAKEVGRNSFRTDVQSFKINILSLT